MITLDVKGMGNGQSMFFEKSEARNKRIKSWNMGGELRYPNVFEKDKIVHFALNKGATRAVEDGDLRCLVERTFLFLRY